MITTEVRGETLWLLPQRAVYWPRVGALIIADAHFGKAATFRAGGIPVPGGTTAEMLRRLSAALDATAATRLLVLGDLLHARAGRAPEMLAQVAAWRATRPDLGITLIRGNHDSRAGDPPGEWGVECLDAPVVELPFTWHHQPPVHRILILCSRTKKHRIRILCHNKATPSPATSTRPSPWAATAGP